MTTDFHVIVRDWQAWSPACETRAAWRAWAGRAANDPADAIAPAALPMLMRRRLTPLGQKLAAAGLASTPPGPEPRYVLATRHGELARTVSILAALAADELPSPADFGVSVHHSLIGLLSIHAGNRAGHTAVVAGRDSFGFAFLEAAASLAEVPEQPVLLLFSSDALPAEYAAFADPDATGPRLALAVTLATATGAAPDETIIFSASPAMGQAPTDTSAALDFLRFLLSGAPAVRSAGDRMDWRWRRAA